MKVLIVYAHHDPRSFCHGVLEHFTEGLRDAGHTSEVIDLHAIGFDPVFRATGLENRLFLYGPAHRAQMLAEAQGGGVLAPGEVGAELYLGA
jgi:putative NADPH-quinone reductase